MSLIVSKYDEKNLIDECWYDSSNIYYSKCYDKLNEYKDLEVVFKDGRVYKYLNLPVQSYLLFREGGLSGSQGKSLNEFIKKYKFEKLEKVDITLLEEMKKKILDEKENLVTEKCDSKAESIVVEDVFEEDNMVHFKEQDLENNLVTKELYMKLEEKQETKPYYIYDNSEIKIGDHIYYALLETIESDSSVSYTLISIPENKLNEVIVVRSKIKGGYKSILPAVRLKS